MDEKNKKRAERRINRKKKGKEGFEYYHRDDDILGFERSENEIKKLKGKYSKTRTFCSNPYCCGNSRRVKGRINLTPQELKSMEDNFFDDEEFDNPNHDINNGDIE